jgi:hypothetical protein
MKKQTGKELPIVITFMNLGNGELKYCKVLFFILLIGKWGVLGYH